MYMFEFEYDYTDIEQVARCAFSSRPRKYLIIN